MNAISDDSTSVLVAAIVAVFVFLLISAFALGKRAAARHESGRQGPKTETTGYRSMFQIEPMNASDRPRV